MSERDELARVLNHAIGGLLDLDMTATDGAYVLQTAADAILAAGYSKPRTVTTVEELDALPEGSMILDSDPDALLKTKGGQWRSLIDPEQPYGSGYLTLPATVLHEGEK